MTREAGRCPLIIRVNTHHIPLKGRTRFGRTARTFWLKNMRSAAPNLVCLSLSLHPEFCLQDKNGIVARRRSRSGDDVGTWKTVAWQCRRKKKIVGGCFGCLSGDIYRPCLVLPTMRRRSTKTNRDRKTIIIKR